MPHAHPAAHPPLLHAGVETQCCPWCGQSITHGEFREIEERIKAEERLRLAQYETDLNERFELEQTARAARAEAELQRLKDAGATALEQEQKRSVEREVAARAEAREAAVAELGEQLATAHREKLAAEEAKKGAERDKLETLNQERKKASKDLQALEGRIAQLQKEKDESIAAAQEEKKKAAEREDVVRAEARQATLTERNAQLAKAQTEKVVAQEAREAAERKLQTEQEELRLHHQDEIQKLREALEKDKEAALNHEKAKAFSDQQKFESKIEELKRQNQSKTSSELGEGAEVDLFDSLKSAFQDDRINRIDKGEAGADIRHDVIHQGEVCGTIVYDSKNRKQWRHEYVHKLRADQLAAEADHALLTTRFFPAGESQVCLRDGIIIANPARAVVLVHLLRDHIIQAHRLRLSGEDRERKTGQLYEFMISDRCEQLLRRTDDLTNDLLELDVKEQAAHERTWQHRGTLLRSSEKAHREFRSEVGRIIGA